LIVSIRRILETRPRPRPHSDHWRRFLRTQAASILACDSFTVETLRLKTLFLFFIELETRRVLIAGITDRPSPGWATQIARNVATELGERQSEVRFLVRDRDRKYRCGFDEVFASDDEIVSVDSSMSTTGLRDGRGRRRWHPPGSKVRRR
jgi:putative transposase